MSNPNASEKANTLRLIRLLNDHGTEGLRIVFDRFHAPAVLDTDLKSTAVHSRLAHMLRANVLNKSQWDILYPTLGFVDSKNFDISLLYSLLRSICGLKNAKNPIWTSNPPATDRSIEANIARIRWYRNDVVHNCAKGVDNTEFESAWKEIAATLEDLGVNKEDIAATKLLPLDSDWYIQLLEEWKDEEKNLKTITKVLAEKVDELIQNQQLLRTDQGKKELLRKLAFLDFSKDIEFFSSRYHPETREWLFSVVDDWTKSTESKSRVLVVTGKAGMGKTVFAAETCRRMNGEGLLAAAHFCRYNNFRRRSPKVMFQSLARSLCEALPDYKSSLLDHLSNNLGQELEQMNQEELFTLLFLEPLRNVPTPDHNLLFVIDALDECEYNGINELLEVVADHFIKLPLWLKFLLTSRPEVKTVEKLERFDPLVLIAEDDQNIEDIEIYVAQKIEPFVKGEHLKAVVSSIVNKSEGLFLYAYFFVAFLSKVSKTKTLVFDDVHQVFPKGIASVYEKFFARLKKGLQDEGIREDRLFDFLSALAVAREPLPVSTAMEVLGITSDLQQGRKNMKKAMGPLSILLPLHDDRIHIFHKSVTDWLVKSESYGEHEFLVDTSHGDRILAKTCTNTLHSVKIKKRSHVFTEEEKYALQHGAYHVSQTPDRGSRTFALHSCLCDIELVHAKLACPSLSPFSIIEEFQLLLDSEDLTEDEVREIRDFTFCLRRHAKSLQKNPDLLFQYLFNEAECCLVSLEADGLLSNEKFEDLISLEIVNRRHYEDPVLATISCESEITSLAVSRDSKHVTCGCRDGSLHLWSLTSSKLIWKTNTRLDSVDCCVFAPKSSYILFGWLSEVYTLDGKSLPFLNDPKDYNFKYCSYSPDGEWLVTSDGSFLVHIFKPNKKLLARTLSHDELVTCCTFYPRDNAVFTGCVDGTVRIWDAQMGLQLTSVKVWGSVPHALKYTTSSSDDYLLLIEKNAALCLRITHMYKLMKRPVLSRCNPFADEVILPAELYHCYFLGTSRKGDSVFMDGECQIPNVPFSVQYVNYFQTGLEVVQNAVLSEVVHVAISTVLTRGFNFLVLHRISRVPEKHLTGGYELSFTANGKLYALPGEGLTIHSFVTGEVLEIHRHFKGAKSFCISPDSSSVLISIDNRLELWNSELTQLERIFEDESGRSCICFLEDGTVLAGYRNGTLRGWDVASGQRTYLLENSNKSPIMCCDAAARQKRVVVVNQESVVTVWNIESQAIITEERFTCGMHYFCCKFSPDGLSVAVVCGNDVLILDSSTLSTLVTFREHTRSARKCDFIPNSALMVSTSLDNTLRIWDDTGKEVALMEFCEWARSLAVSPRGDLLAVGLKTGKIILIKIWTKERRQAALRPVSRQFFMFNRFLLGACFKKWPSFLFSRRKYSIYYHYPTERTKGHTICFYNPLLIIYPSHVHCRINSCFVFYPNHRQKNGCLTA